MQFVHCSQPRFRHTRMTRRGVPLCIAGVSAFLEAFGKNKRKNSNPPGVGAQVFAVRGRRFAFFVFGVAKTNDIRESRKERKGKNVEIV